MAKEPNAPKGLTKKPPGSTPVSSDKPAPAAATKAPALKTKLSKQANPTVMKSSAESEAPVKVVRKAPPTPELTTPITNNTVALDAPAQEPVKRQVTLAPKSAAATGAAKPTAEKAASMLGDYKLLKKLGQGGMGSVYKAHDVKNDRVVAIKVLAKELSNKEAYVQRFEREARVMEKMDHPNVLRFLFHGEAKGFHFISIEFVDGGSVEGWLKKLGRFSIGDAMHIILKTAYALKHAHEKSLIHRDIKPDNILLTKDGVVKLADLGLAKDTDEDVSLTKTGAGAGTPIYMAPEQARDVKHVDARVDIYALGVMLYVFLTGQAPFQGTTLVELISAKEKGKFDPIRKYNDEVPPKIDLIVDKMIAKDPKLRYASCDEIIKVLEPLGLANDELSFLAPPDEAEEAPVAKRGTRAAAPTATPSLAAKLSPKTTVASKPLGVNTSVPEEKAERDVWYFKIEKRDGNSTIKKVSTEQVRALINAGHLDATSLISKTEKSGFRAAATFTDFQSLFKSRQTATKANSKGQKYRDRFKEIEEEDARRRKWGWLSRMFSGLGSMLFGLLWIILIFGIVGGAGYFAYVRFIQQ